MHKLPSSFPAPILILAPDPDQALTAPAAPAAPIAEAPLLTEAGIAQATERAAAALTAPAAPAAAAAPVLLASSQQVKNHPVLPTEFYFDAPYSDNYDEFIKFENSKQTSLRVFIVDFELSKNPPAKTTSSCFGGKNSDSVNYQDTLMGDKTIPSHPQYKIHKNKNVVNLYHFKTSDSQTSKEHKIFLSSDSYVELKKSMEKVKMFLDDIKSKASPPNSFDNNDFKNLNLYIRNELQKSKTKTNLKNLNELIDNLSGELNSQGIQYLKSKISPTSTTTQSPNIEPTNLTDQLFSSLLHDNFLLIENSASIVRETDLSTSQINVSTYSYKFSGSIRVASPDKNPTICKIENDTLKEVLNPPSIPNITHTTFEIENSNVTIKTFQIDQKGNINTRTSPLNQSPSLVVAAPVAAHVATAAAADTAAGISPDLAGKA